jgi:hypothetical protein
VASIPVTLLPDDRITPIQRRLVDDLPAHVKGLAQWLTQPGKAPGYYVTSESNKLEPVELINNEWYHLGFHQRSFGTRTTLLLQRGTWGLGYWKLTDPNTQTSSTPLEAPPAPDSATTLVVSHLTPQDLVQHQNIPPSAYRACTTQTHLPSPTQPHPSVLSQPRSAPQPHQATPPSVPQAVPILRCL